MYEEKEISTFLSSDIKLLFDRTNNVNYDYREEESTCALSVFQQLDLLLDGKKDNSFESNITIEELEDCSALLKKLSLNTEDSLNMLDLSWTGMEEVMRNTLTWLSNPNKCYHYMALLQICSVIERVLGKVYQIVGSTVPFLLRDLINTPELENIFGRELVHFLKILIGSVHGFNFRNIAWHGFLGIEDIHKSHSIVLLYTLHKCGEILKKKNLNISCSSKLIDLQMTVSYCEKGMIKEFEKDDPMEISAKSKLVYKNMIPLWHEAVYLISRRNNDAILLLLPLLENSLRILYATVNDCPLKMLTATDSTFYVTMDEILSPWMKSSEFEPSETADTDEGFISFRVQNGSKYNFVPQYLGRPLTESLYDLLHYVSGPRLRDRTSHGEILPTDIPFGTIHHLFRLCLLVLSVDRWRFSEGAQFTIKCSCESFKCSDKCTHHYPSELEQILKNLFFQNFSSPKFCGSFLTTNLTSYEVKFHPAIILKLGILDIVLLIKNWIKWKYPKDDFEVSWEDFVPSHRLSHDWTYMFGNYSVKSLIEIEEFIKCVSKPLESTLFSSKIELEIVRTLHRISSAIKKSLNNIESSLNTRYTLYISKSLRSRQRETYIKQIGSIPCIIYHLYICIQMIYFILESYQHWRHVDASCFSPLKKMLKNVLKVVENLVSFTDPLVNNYHTASAKLTENTKIINDYFSLSQK